MTRLTEEMVIARSKQSDLGSIKKLNCWGSDLTDVSIIKRMREVEVLALSVNKITTLQPFEDCQKLQELYLRKNNIQDLNEINYLQNLPNLKYLWLEENPCCDRVGPNYRSIVLKTLPNLMKLDNVEVTPEEVKEATKVDGSPGTGTVPKKETFDDTFDTHAQHHNQQQTVQHQPYEGQHQQSNHHQQQHQRQPSQALQQYHQSPQYHQRGSSSPQKERSPDTDQESPHGGGGGSGGSGYRERVPIPPSASTHSMKEYYQTDRPPYPGHYRHSQTDLTEWEDHHQHQNLSHNSYGSTAALHNVSARRPAGHDRQESMERYSLRNGRDNGDWEDDRDRRSRRPDGRFADSASTVSTAVLNHYANYHRRPINRSSNLLSATLCLIKELDYASLEVVEHAVRCRIDELSAD